MNATPCPFPAQSHVVAYLRDSGGDQQDLSITQQKASLERWAAENEITISLFYIDEARPGSTTVGRNAFQRMVNHFRQPLISEKGLVLWSFSRFARDINSAMLYKSEIRSKGYVVYSITDNIPEGLDGILFESLGDWSNAKFLEKLSTDAKRGIHFNIDNYGAIGGVPPKGFRRETMNVGKRRDGTPHIVSRWVPDPELWETCKTAWQMRLQGKTYREINEVCHLYGAVNSYVTFFSNRLYLGELILGNQTVPNYVEPMIDEATWQKVQELKNPRNNPKRRPENMRREYSRFLLSGLVFCARCGAPMNGNVVKFSGDKKEYRYYICSRAGQRHECDALRIPQETMEAAVLEKIYDYMLNPQLVYERQLAELAASSQKASDLNQQKSELNKKIGAVRKKIKNLMEALEDNGKKSASVMERIAEREQEEKVLKDQLLAIVNEEVFGIGNISAEEARANAENWLKSLHKEDPAQLKKLFHSQIHHIDAEKDGKRTRGMIYFYGPPGEPPAPGAQDDSDDKDLCVRVVSPWGHSSLQRIAVR